MVEFCFTELMVLCGDKIMITMLLLLCGDVVSLLIFLRKSLNSKTNVKIQDIPT